MTEQDPGYGEQRAVDEGAWAHEMQEPRPDEETTVSYVEPLYDAVMRDLDGFYKIIDAAKLELAEAFAEFEITTEKGREEIVVALDEMDALVTAEKVVREVIDPRED